MVPIPYDTILKARPQVRINQRLKKNVIGIKQKPVTWRQGAKEMKERNAGPQRKSDSSLQRNTARGMRMFMDFCPEGTEFTEGSWVERHKDKQLRKMMKRITDLTGEAAVSLLSLDDLKYSKCLLIGCYFHLLNSIRTRGLPG